MRSRLSRGVGVLLSLALLLQSSPLAYGQANGPGTPSATASPTNAPIGAGTSIAIGFPRTAVLDDFNRANGNLGASWTGARDTGVYRVLGSQLQVRNSGYVYWNQSSFGPDQEAYVTFKRLARGAGDQDLLLKVNGAAPDGGTGGNNLSAIEVHYDAVHGRVLVQTAVPYTPARPTWVVHHDFPLTLQDGDQLGARTLADGTVQVYRNGWLVGQTSVTQGPHPFPASLAAGGGRIGLWVIDASADDPSLMDDFGGGTVQLGSSSPTATLSPTATASRTSTPSSTATPSGTTTRTRTSTATDTATASHTATATPTGSATATASATNTVTSSEAATGTATPSETASATPTDSPTASATDSAIPTSTATSTATATETATATATATWTATDTATPSPTETATPFPTLADTSTSTATATPTATSSPSATSTPVPPLCGPSDISWVRPASGSWHDAANWSLNRVPGAGDDVCIDVPGADVVVTHSSNVTTSINSLRSREAIVLSAGMLYLAAPSRIEAAFTHSNAWLRGAGDLSVDGRLSLSNAFLEGPGATMAGGGIALSDTVHLIGRTVNNAGTATWTGPGATVISYNGPVWHNLPGSVFDSQDDQRFGHAFGSLLSFVNHGAAGGRPAAVVRKSGGAGVSELSNVTFTNDGEVRAQSGTLRLTVGGAANSQGVFEAADGAVLELSGGSSPHTLGSSSSVVGAGRVRFNADGGAGVVLDGRYAVAGTTELPRGQVEFNGDATTGVLELTGGTLAGKGLFTIASPTGSTWSGGTMRGPGTTVVPPGVALTVSGLVTLDGRTVANSGTATLIGSGTGFQAFNGTLWRNLPGSVYDSQGDHQFIPGFGAPSVFDNYPAAGALPPAVVRKSGGAGSSSITLVFTNYGTVEARAGTLAFGGGMRQVAGATLLLGGNLGGDTTRIEGGLLSGTGSVSGHLIVDAAEVRPGGRGAVGTLALGGAYTPSAATRLEIEVGGPGCATWDRLIVGHGATAVGRLDVELIDGCAPALSDVFAGVVSYNVRSGSFDLTAGYLATYWAQRLDLHFGVMASPLPERCQTLLPPGSRAPGGAFVTGHDADHHANVGDTYLGARHIIQRAVAYVTADRPSPRILLVTSRVDPQFRDTSDPRLGLQAAGFAAVDLADQGSGAPGVLDLHTVAFGDYDAVVIASDFGGWLRQAELSVLNARSADLIAYVNAGGGLVAFAESGAIGLTSTDRFAFLPFLATAVGDVPEQGNRVTSLGQAMGLVPSDVNGNISHLIFTATGGMDLIDVLPSGQPISLASRGRVVGPSGVDRCLAVAPTPTPDPVATPTATATATITATPSATAVAAVLKADYQLQNTHASSAGAAPPLADIGSVGGFSFAAETVDGLERTVMRFPQGGGLSLAPTTGVLSNESYSVAVLFRFDTVSGFYRRVIDVKNRASETGLYIWNGDLVFWNATGGTGAPIAAGAWVQVVLTRDAAGTVAGYVDGAPAFSFADVDGLGVISGSNDLHLFTDNTRGIEDSSGAVARVRVYDRALTAAEVAALDRLPLGPTPTPGTPTVTLTPTITPTPFGLAPSVSLGGLAEGSTITAPTTISGTVEGATLLGWALRYRLAGEEGWTTFGGGTSPVAGGTLGTFDPTLLLNGIYEVQLIASDVSGRLAESSTSVVVEGNMKVGNVSLAFTDLTVPASGIPVQLVRSYDSRDKGVGDFGVGWRLSLGSGLRVQENRPVGREWRGTKTPGAFPTYCIEPTRPHLVTVTGPDGKVYRFEATVSPSCQAFAPLSEVTVELLPLPGTNASLAAENATVLVVGSWPGPLELWDFDAAGEAFQFADLGRYHLTLKDGTELVLDQRAGLKSVRDRNGNTLSVGPTEVVHSSGRGVALQRDGQGRITRISGPGGDVLSYGYDGRGDLVAVTDQIGVTTRFAYDAAHNLLSVADPLGRQATRNEYDAGGRLVAVTDAAGGRIELAHDLGARTEVVRDQLGNPTIYAFDARGNIVARTDPLGNRVTAAYDGRDNRVSETDPLGQTTRYAYDASDNLLSRTDPLGNVARYTYDGRGQPLSHTDPLGRTTTFAYDGRGNLLSRADPLGQTTRYLYDAAGRLTARTDPLGQITAFEYDGAGNPVRRTDPGGGVTTYGYDADGRVVSAALPDGRVVGYDYDATGRLLRLDVGGEAMAVVYDPAGQPTQFTDARGRVTRFEYDARERLTAVLSAGGAAFRREYDAAGNLVAQTDGLGNATRYEHDAAGRVTAVVGPDGTTERHSYDPAGRLVRVVDPRGNATEHGYDALGREVRRVDALGGVTTWRFDAAGNLEAVVDPLGRSTAFEYEPDGAARVGYRPVRVRLPDGAEHRFAYDAVGRRTEAVDPAGQATRFAYDPLGRLTAVTDALGNTTRYERDLAGRLTGQMNANGARTAYAYDPRGRWLRTTYPLGGVESATYDAVGRLATMTNGNGETRRYVYDANGRLAELELPDGTRERRTYTGDGRVSTLTDGRGATRYDYDPVTRRLVRVTEPDGGYVRYGYDPAGNRTTTAHALAGGPETVVRYGYDGLNRLAEVDAGGGIARYGYDPAGNRIAVTLPNGATTAAGYDALNRLTSVAHRRADGTVLGRFDYSLDLRGNRTAVTQSGGSRVEYGYDALSRLTDERHVDPAGATLGEVGYAYDPVGNLLARTSSLPGVGSASFVYNADDQLVAADATAYGYDGAGNRVTAADGGTVTRYRYDPRGRLVEVQPSAGGPVTYTYDATGIRQSKSGPTGTVRYLVDRHNPTGLPQVVRESDPDGATLRTYTYGHALLAGTAGGTGAYYLADALGSTRLVADDAGAATDRYGYAAYGQTLAQAGMGSHAYLFAGQQLDPESGLYYMRARYYDPQAGRFLSRDPVQGDPATPLARHRYLYAHANPATLTDPSGRESLATSGVVYGGGLTVVVPRFTRAAAATTSNPSALDSCRDMGRGCPVSSHPTVVAALQAARLVIMQTLVVLEGLDTAAPNDPDAAAFRQYFSRSLDFSDDADVDPELHAVVLNVFYRVWDLAYGPPTFYQGVSEGDRAYTYSTDPVVRANREVWLTSAWFQSPQIGENSQVGTIVHELAHLALGDDQLMGRGEEVYSLAEITSMQPERQIRNAENYEAFAVEVAGW